MRSSLNRRTTEKEIEEDEEEQKAEEERLRYGAEKQAQRIAKERNSRGERRRRAERTTKQTGALIAFSPLPCNVGEGLHRLRRQRCSRRRIFCREILRVKALQDSTGVVRCMYSQVEMPVLVYSQLSRVLEESFVYRRDWSNGESSSPPLYIAHSPSPW